MKKLLQVRGVTELTRKEQQHILGGACTQKRGLCCITLSNGSEFCEAGICQYGSCLYY